MPINRITASRNTSAKQISLSEFLKYEVFENVNLQLHLLIFHVSPISVFLVYDITMVQYIITVTASAVLLSEFLTTDPEVPGSIPGATRFSEK
jgi:hypothetical protein